MGNDDIKKDLDKLSDVVGNKDSDLKEKKSLVLLNNILSQLSESKDIDSKNAKKVIDFLNSLDKKQLNKDDFEFFSKIFLKLDELNILVGESFKNIKKENQDAVIAEIKNLVNAIDEKKYPEEIKISNQKEFPEKISVDNFPKQRESVKVENLDEISREVKVMNSLKIDNFPEPLPYPSEIDVNRIKEPVTISKPKWYEKFNTDAFLDKLSNIYVNLLDILAKNIYDVNIDKYKKEKEALAVKIVDKDGKFIKDLFPHVNVSPGGGGPDTVGLKNGSNVRINPATEDKQNDTITAIEEVTSNSEDTQVTEGGQAKQVTVDFNQEELMEQMLIELKKISFQMAILTDTILKEEDINN